MGLRRKFVVVPSAEIHANLKRMMRAKKCPKCPRLPHIGHWCDVLWWGPKFDVVSAVGIHANLNSSIFD